MNSDNTLKFAYLNNLYVQTDLILSFKVTIKHGKCSRSTILALVLLMIVIGLVAFIVVTYVKELQCYDDGDNHRESKKLISFLLFSDVHLDPFYKSDSVAGKKSFCRNESMPSTYNAPYGRIGCDSPSELLHEVVNAMKQRANNLSNLDFIMLSGNKLMNFFKDVGINHRHSTKARMKEFSELALWSYRMSFMMINYYK